ncbi:MAG: hypothetical protein JXQ97_08020 [Natronospirillum sp.]
MAESQHSMDTGVTVNLTLKMRRPLGGLVEQLLFVPDRPVTYQAGQYLELLLPDQAGLYFTIANAPGSDIELHVEAGPENAGARALLTRIDNETTIAARVGEGDCHVGKLAPDDSPVLLLASGTGFSQIKAVTEALLVNSARPVHIYWAARTAAALYMADMAQSWADTHEQVHFTAVISERQTWNSGKHHLHSCIREDLGDLGAYSAICCGSPDMVYASLDYLSACGLKQERFFSDMLAFAPR